MRYITILVLLTASAFWLGNYAFENSADVVINWGNWGSITLTSTTVIISVITFFLALLLFIFILRFLFGIRKRIRNHKQKKLTAIANIELTKGLLHFTEGHWKQSEKTLIDNVQHSKTPLLNYLAAARAAHMQEKYDRRDTYLKKASEQGKEALIAVSISQADMQFSSKQLEQARATLIHLLEVSPKHPHAIKLLAKIYYHQEDWSNLFTLLPELSQQSLITQNDRDNYEVTALSGIFMTLAHKKDLSKMQTLWKKLPVEIRKKPQTILLYCKALNDTADNTHIINRLLIKSLENKWNESLVELYGLLDHDKLGSAIKRAELWLESHETSPQLLLALARLNRKYKLWGKTKIFYNSSLNFSPSTAVYLELAELLEELGEKENAQTCYKLGLKYSIHKKGTTLSLKPGKSADASLAIVPAIDEDAFSA